MIKTGIKAWITVNGNHIPIMDGESKMAAVGRFIKGKRKDKATRLKEFNEKLQKHEGKEDYVKWGMKNYPVKTIYGNTLTETRKRNQEKYNELYEKNKERLKKYSKEELLERASGKIQTGDGERAYKKSWIEHDLAHYNTKKEFIPERDKYKGKSYKLKEKYKVGDIYTNGDSTFRIVAHPKTGKPMAQYYDKHGVYHQSIIDKDWEKGMAISRTKYKKVKK